MYAFCKKKKRKGLLEWVSHYEFNSTNGHKIICRHLSIECNLVSMEMF